MILTSLAIHDFRNLAKVQLSLAARFNAFYGDNGGGKTSVLEAIYFLAMAKSFRCHTSRYIVRDTQPALSVFAQGCAPDGETATVGVSKPRAGTALMKHRGEVVRSPAEWVKLLPVLICHHDTYQLLDAGPKVRRQFIDWGVFHVKHAFLPAWQTLQKVLKQRNSGLRAALPSTDIAVWDAQLVEATHTLTALREAYLAEFMPVFEGLLAEFMVLEGLSVDFYVGWPDHQDYQTVLHESLYRDRQYGYTRHGAHRADLTFLIDGKPAIQVLSRGQQKVFVTALKLAQGKLLQAQQSHCVYLFDDLPSELDEDKQSRVVGVLAAMGSQLFITGIEASALQAHLPSSDTQMFHVKQGVIQPVT